MTLSALRKVNGGPDASHNVEEVVLI